MNTTAPPYDLHASLGYHLSVAARLQERRLEEGLRSLGLTRTTWCILLAVGNSNRTQPSDIAAFVGIDRTATSRALRLMENDDLIDRTTGRQDRRTTQVRLTRKGKQALARGTPFAEANNAALAAKLGETAEADLRALLVKLIEDEELSLERF